MSSYLNSYQYENLWQSCKICSDHLKECSAKLNFWLFNQQSYVYQIVINLVLLTTTRSFYYTFSVLLPHRQDRAQYCDLYGFNLTDKSIQLSLMYLGKSIISTYQKYYMSTISINHFVGEQSHVHRYVKIAVIGATIVIN